MSNHQRTTLTSWECMVRHHEALEERNAKEFGEVYCGALAKTALLKLGICIFTQDMPVAKMRLAPEIVAPRTGAESSGL